MMMAMTPSLKASRRFFSIAAPLADPPIFLDKAFLVTHLLVVASIVAAAPTERLERSIEQVSAGVLCWVRTNSLIGE
jgi:hypothetical protein